MNRDVEAQVKYQTIGGLVATDWAPDVVRDSVAKQILRLRDDLTLALESQDPRDLPLLVKLSGLAEVWPEPSSENMTQIQRAFRSTTP